MQLGGTIALAQVSAYLSEPATTRPNEGILRCETLWGPIFSFFEFFFMSLTHDTQSNIQSVCVRVNVDFGSTCAPRFQQGPRFGDNEEESVEVNRVLERCLKGPFTKDVAPASFSGFWNPPSSCQYHVPKQINTKFRQPAFL